MISNIFSNCIPLQPTSNIPLKDMIKTLRRYLNFIEILLTIFFHARITPLICINSYRPHPLKSYVFSEP